MRIIMATAALGLVACSGTSGDHTQTPQWQFYQVNMKSLCGQTLTGSVVSDDPEDADWRGKVLTVGPVECSDARNNSAIRMPLAVGDDQSRQWSLIPRADGLLLSHRHTFKDGSPDPVTGYGGLAEEPGTATRKNFPVDEFSKALFLENGLDASVTNVWTMEIIPGEVFAYELNREGRHFRAEFPLSP
ncbi:hypothetical protein ACJ3XI_01670 [Litorimonas sp. RW-G-Af-16]|uniref:hypothetical protein n=1 Tax=Litorimonas sp. RW-G-Af-16 TaxID=3241168 RepID=UPI00390C5EFE